MEIIRGKMPHALKLVLYGVEGIGKSTFMTHMPDPLFIDTERGSGELDIARLPAPTSWEMLKEEAWYVADHPDCCRSLIIDTADWAERMCTDHVINKDPDNREGNNKGIEQFGWGKGYRYVYDAFGDFLNILSTVVDKGVNVGIVAHAALRKFEQPDEMGSYDRWEMKLLNSQKCNIAAMVKEWADILLFANYKTNTVAIDKEGKKKKAIGEGHRVMYATHHACWDAKNRYGLPDIMDFDFSEIAHIFQDIKPAAVKTEALPKSSSRKQHPEPAEGNTSPEEVPMKSADPAPETAPEPDKVDPVAEPVAGRTAEQYKEPDPRIPKALRDLMIANRVTDWDIQDICQAKGYYPSDVDIWDYDPDFIDGCLVGAWDQVLSAIKDMWDKEEIPFN